MHDFYQYIAVFIFQQDTAPCHVAAVCKKWFQDNHTPLLKWLENSQDLNPIENLWSELKKLVRQKQLSNKIKLIEALNLDFIYYIFRTKKVGSLHGKVLQFCNTATVKVTQLSYYWHDEDFRTTNFISVFQFS